jgi:hypothetical protein
VSMCFACVTPIQGESLAPSEGGELFHPECVEVREWQAGRKHKRRTVVGAYFTRHGVKYIGTYRFSREREREVAASRALRNACRCSASDYRGYHRR